MTETPSASLPYGKITGALALLGFTTLGARHAYELKAVVHGDCPYLAKVVPKLAPIVKKSEEKFQIFADCDALTSIAGARNISMYMDGAAVSHGDLRSHCQKWKLSDAELRHVFTGPDEGSDVLVHGFTYGTCPMSGKKIRKHVVAQVAKKENARRSIKVSIGRTCNPAFSADTGMSEDPEGAQLILGLEDAMSTGNCERFLGNFAEDATHQNLESYSRGPSAMHGKAEILEHCERKAEKMHDIMRLSFAQPVATISHEEEGGLRTTTMLFERSKKVKFSPKIHTSAVAWVVGHRNGKIERSSFYDLEAKNLIDKYGYKYGAESTGFLSAFGKKEEGSKPWGDRKWSSSERKDWHRPASAKPATAAVAAAKPASALWESEPVSEDAPRDYEAEAQPMDAEEEDEDVDDDDEYDGEDDDDFDDDDDDEDDDEADATRVGGQASMTLSMQEKSISIHVAAETRVYAKAQEEEAAP